VPASRPLECRCFIANADVPPGQARRGHWVTVSGHPTSVPHTLARGFSADFRSWWLGRKSSTPDASAILPPSAIFAVTNRCDAIARSWSKLTVIPALTVSFNTRHRARAVARDGQRRAALGAGMRSSWTCSSPAPRAASPPRARRMRRRAPCAASGRLVDNRSGASALGTARTRHSSLVMSCSRIPSACQHDD